MTERKNKNPWQTLSSRLIYENPWIRVREDQVIRPDGQKGIYGVVHFKNIAVGVIAIDSEGCIQLVGQHRYPLDQYSWEIPEGGSPSGEEPLTAAKRELLEETGLRARQWTELGETYLSNSVSDERAIWFLATDLEQGEARPDGSEVIETRRVPFDEALQMIDRREISDALTLIGLLQYARRLYSTSNRGLGLDGYKPSNRG